MSYRIEGLAPAPFRALFSLDDAALAERHITRSIVTEAHSAPCRVSLADADEGDEVVLFSHTHLDVDSPYRAAGPIFVRRRAVEETDDPRVLVGCVPDVLARRLLSVRGYDAKSRIHLSEVCDGKALGAQIETLFGIDEIAFLHVHYARNGCYAARVERG